MLTLILELAVLAQPARARRLSKRQAWAAFASCVVVDLGVLMFVFGV